MKNVIVLFACVLLLNPCGSSHVIKQPLQLSVETPGTPPSKVQYKVRKVKSTIGEQEDVSPEHLLAAIKGCLKAELTKRGQLATGHASDVYSGAVDVTYYRKRGGIVRYMFGTLAGKDGIDSPVTVTNRDTGQMVGESEDVHLRKREK